MPSAEPAGLRRIIGPALSGTRGAAMGAFSLAITKLAHVRLFRIEEPRRTQIRQRWVRHWARGLRLVFGVDRTLCGAAPTVASHARLVVANHRSPLDIILMLECFGGSVLARHDLERWPVLGEAARMGDTIFVDRQDPHSGVKAIREIRRKLNAQQTVIAFPEGTTHADPEIRAFQAGAFSAARGLDVELLPVGIAYETGAEFFNETFTQHVLRVAQRPRTRVAVCIGEPLRGGGKRDAMASELHAAVAALERLARAEVSRAGR